MHSILLRNLTLNKRRKGYRGISPMTTFPQLKPRSPYGGLLAACLFGLLTAKLVKNKLEEDKINGYGCREHPKKYISSPPTKN